MRINNVFGLVIVNTTGTIGMYVFVCRNFQKPDEHNRTGSSRTQSKKPESKQDNSKNEMKESWNQNTEPNDKVLITRAVSPLNVLTK